MLSADRRISTVVVLMMENRSFDNLVGWLKRNNSEIDGLTGSECNTIPGTPGSSTGNGTEGDGATAPREVCVTDDAAYIIEDPDHSFQGATEQIFGTGKPDGTNKPNGMGGFAHNAELTKPGSARHTMAAFAPDAVPVTSALAAEFALCDRWFSSVPGPTFPNRFYAQSATSAGMLSNQKEVLAVGFWQRTIFDVLSKRGVPWGIYFHDIPASLSLRSLRTAERVKRYRPFALFRSHARAGKLPAFTFIEPQYFNFPTQPANDDHPGHDVRFGQKLIKDVYEALRVGPQWNRTLLIVTYDEHGGLYDHVQPPASGVPSPDGIVGDEQKFEFKMLGVRVPTFVISPWIDKGTVIHRPRGPRSSSQFDHASIPATLRDVFGLKRKSDYLTERDKWAGSIMPFLKRDKPRTDCPRFLPDIPEINNLPFASNLEKSLSELQLDMISIAASLSPVPPTPAAIKRFARNMRVREGASYVRAAVNHFLKRASQGKRLVARCDDNSRARTPKLCNAMDKMFDKVQQKKDFAIAGASGDSDSSRVSSVGRSSTGGSSQGGISSASEMPKLPAFAQSAADVVSASQVTADEVFDPWNRVERTVGTAKRSQIDKVNGW